MLNKINQIINPLYLDYIVVNHMELEPDSMETFLEEDKILFSNDGFGQYLATEKRYDFEIEDAIPAAAEYYANIMMPYENAVLRYLNLL